jgi:hypothetical protein
MPDFNVIRLANGDFRVDPIGTRPAEIPFGARFQTEMFDCGQSQGLVVRLARGNAYGFRIYRHQPAAAAAHGLRMLANWIEANA